MQRDFGPRFTLDELVEATGVSKRNVRYYIGEGLVPSAAGKGRNSYYTAGHVEALARIRELRERNLSIDEIRQTIEAEHSTRPVPVVGQNWRRVQLHTDLELNIRDGAPESVQALVHQLQQTAAEWFGHYDDE